MIENECSIDQTNFSHCHARARTFSQGHVPVQIVHIINYAQSVAYVQHPLLQTSSLAKVHGSYSSESTHKSSVSS